MPLCFDLQSLKEKYDCNIYFETGLWDVDAEDTSLCKASRMDFERLYSVEINTDFVSKGKKKFSEEIESKKMNIFQGDSKKLKEYLSSLSFDDKDRIVFFLDSHGSGHGCPLVEELDAIKEMSFKNPPIIILDDVRIIRSCCWSDRRYNGASFEDILKQKIKDIHCDYVFSYLDGYQKDDCLLASF